MLPSEIKLTRPARILIVEDDPDQRRLLRKIVRKVFPCETWEARDGLEGLEIILQDRLVPDLILLDLMMPCLNGVEFLHVIRGREAFDHLPIIVCTALPETSEIRGKLNGKIHSYLVKPIQSAELIEKVLAALEPIRCTVVYQP